MSNITIYEIAKIAGVSASTVSRVINGKPGVNKETRKRVTEYLEKYHYSPNEAARGLVTGSHKMIGVLISDMRTAHHTDGLAYIQKELASQGYLCLIMNTGHGDEDKASYIQQLSQRRVDAVMLIGSTFESQIVGKAISEYIPRTPVVISNGYIDLPNVYGVIADERNGTVECVKHLASQNRKNLAFILDYETPSNLLKVEGFKFGLQQYINNNEVPRIIKTGPDFQGVYDTTRRLMEEHPETDGIIYSEDPLAASGLRALHEGNYAVPSRVAVIGINNSIIAQITTPTLTSLDNMLLELSMTCVRNLIDVLQGKHVVKKMLIYSHLVEREST